MALPKEDSTSRNVMTNMSQDYSIIKNRSYSKLERMAMVRVMTDRLHLTLDDIRNSSVNSDRLKSLSIVPPDLLPFELTLSDGNTVTVMETDPVVTCYDGELTNVKGNIIHIYEKNQQELPEGSILPQKRYTVNNAQSLEKILPLIINDFSKTSPEDSNSYVIPGTSKKIDTPSNIGTRIEEHSKTEVTSTVIASDSSIISPKDPETTKNVNVSTKKNNDDVPSDTNHTVELEKISPQPKDDLHQLSPFSSKFQVIGLVDTGIIRDSGSEEGFHNVVEDVENKDWTPRKEMATIIVDKELSNPSEFRAVFLKTPSPVLRKKTLDVRKSARAPKPKIRSSFKSWDELKIRLPRHSRKGRSSKSTKLTDKKTKVKKN